MATTAFNLAVFRLNEGDLTAARLLLERALASELRALGEENPSLAFTRAQLAQVLDRLGETGAAEREAHEALRVVASQPVGSRFRTQVEQIARAVLRKD